MKNELFYIVREVGDINQFYLEDPDFKKLICKVCSVTTEEL